MVFLHLWSPRVVLSSATRGSSFHGRSQLRESFCAGCHLTPSDDFQCLFTVRFGHTSARARLRNETEKHFGQYKEVDPDRELCAFESMSGAFSERTIRALTQVPYNFTHMTPVQAAVFDYLPGLSDPYNPEASSNESEPPPRDLFVKAKTGTGKTAAFMIPAIEQRVKALDAFGEQALLDSGLSREKFPLYRAVQQHGKENVGALIISPTRELASQIAKEASNLAYHQKGFYVQLFVGGSSKHRQMHNWMTKRRDIVVATPGRLQDVLQNERGVEEAFKRTSLVPPPRTIVVFS